MVDVNFSEFKVNGRICRDGEGCLNFSDCEIPQNLFNNLGKYQYIDVEIIVRPKN